MKYKAILVDPPWSFKTYSALGTGRSAISHYDTMSLKDIEALPIGEMADKDCVLFLWAIDSMLPQALSAIEKWGFKFKTVAFYWVKGYNNGWIAENFFTGMGYWTRANPEQCLLATKGHPKRVSKSVRRLLIAPRREHSRKPAEARIRIEALVGGPYLEMFARDAREGWDRWGDQQELFDKGHVETRRQPSNLTIDRDSLIDAEL